MKSSTPLIHHPYKPPSAFEAPQVGIFKASTVYFPSVAAMRTREWKDKSAYTYGLHGTPTTFTLEERLCSLEGGLQCLLVPSGLSAITTTTLALLSTGDEVLLPDNAYGPGKDWAAGDLQRFGVGVQVYNPMDPTDLRQRITEKTRLVLLEAPGSVTLEFPDLIEQVRICRAQGILTVLDNTWGAGLAFNAFDLLGDGGSLSVDVTVHALTKYPSGGGDVLMGSVVSRKPDLSLELKLCHMRLGLGVAANDAELLLRSLPSLQLRYKQHDHTARALAAWCQTQPQFVQVLHPALHQSPGHVHWQALCNPKADGGMAAGLWSVVVDAQYTWEQVAAFCDALKLFKIGYSWGGPVSLVVPYELASMRSAWPSHIAHGTLVRFSSGLECADDLQADLQQALECLPIRPAAATLAK